MILPAADGFMAARLRAPVPREYPQTPQAAEHLALYRTYGKLVGPSVYVSDCLGVVRLANEAQQHHSLGGKSQYAGEHLGVARHRVPFFEGAVWEPSHKADNPDFSRLERFRWRGNSEADREAKLAVDLHPAILDSKLCEADRVWALSRALLRFAARTLGEWPKPPYLSRESRQRTRRGLRPPGLGRTQRFAPAAPSHWWRSTCGVLQCCRCWHVRDTAPSARCPGFPAFLEGQAGLMRERGHTLRTAAAQRPYVFCTLCGAVAGRRISGLKRDCASGVAGGEQRLQRIRDGKHPWLAEPTVVGMWLEQSIGETHLTTVESRGTPPA